jgi:hypothetical protein
MHEKDDFNKLVTFNADIEQWPRFRKQFELYLTSKRLRHILEHEEDLDTHGTEKEVNRRRETRVEDDATVQGCILSKVSSGLFESLQTYATAREMFNFLKANYETKTLASAVAKLNALMDLKYDPNGDLLNHIGKIHGLITQLKGTGIIDYGQLELVLLLRSMPKNSDWESTTTNLMMREATNLTQESVSAALLERSREIEERKGEARKGEAKKGEDPEFTAFLAWKKSGKATAAVSGRRPRSDWIKDITCYNCQQKGHFALDCKGVKKERDGKGKEPEKPNVNYAFGTAASDSWHIDTGATKHYSGTNENMTEYQTIFDKLIVANGQVLEVKGVGTVIFEMRVGKELLNVAIRNVYYAPDIHANLLSDGVFDSLGLDMKRANGKMTYRFEGKVVFTATKSQNGLWPIDGKPISDGLELKCYAVMDDEEDKEMIWHRRMGHLGERGLKRLAKGDMVNGRLFIPKNKLNCEICASCKITRRPFPISNNPKARFPLDLIHIDLIETRRESRFGEKFALSIVDDHSKAKFAYPLLKKSDAITEFKRWMIWAERMTNRRLKCVRCDNAKELKEGKMKDYLKQIGVEIESTLAYEHEQNGMIERANRTLEDKARCMLSDSGLPYGFWRDAIIAAGFIANRSPIRDEELTPIELLTGIKPDISKIRIFGSVCWARKPVKDIIGSNKFDERGDKCKMIGYSQGGHSYVLIREKDGKTIENTHVIFHEKKGGQEVVSVVPHVKPVEKRDERNGFKFDMIEANLSDEDGERSAEIENEDGSVSGGEEPDNSSGSDDGDGGGSVERENENGSVSGGEEPDNSSGSDAGEQVPQIVPPRRSTRLRTVPVEYWKTPKTPTPAENSVSRRGRVGVRTPTRIIEVRKGERNIANFVYLTHHEALSSLDGMEWKKAMDKEMKTLNEFGTWKKVKLPAGSKQIGCKWIFVRKLNSDGSLGEYKARLTAKGYSQVEGKDFLETFAPVARIQTIRIILVLATEYDWEIFQIDIKAAYLNGWMEEEIYMDQPPEYDDHDGKVCQLIRGLYGTKQAGNIWNKSLNKTLLKHGFRKSVADQCLYVKGDLSDRESFVLVVVYVDDILVVGHDDAILEIRKIIDGLKGEYDVKEMGEVDRYLGIVVKRDRLVQKMWLNQTDFAESILERFSMTQCNGADTPMELKANVEPASEDETLTNNPYRSLVGSLMYLMICTRPDLAHAVGVLSRFLEKPAERHWMLAIRVLRYLKKTKNMGLEYGRKGEYQMVGYSDSDWITDSTTGRSTRGFTIEIEGGLACWKSKRHSTVATSTTVAEIDALYHGVIEWIWIKTLGNDIGWKVTEARWFCDNQATVAILNSEKNVEKIRHVLVKIKYLREQLKNGEFVLEYIPTKEMKADMLTKQLPRIVFESNRTRIGIEELPQLAKWGSVETDFANCATAK